MITYPEMVAIFVHPIYIITYALKKIGSILNGIKLLELHRRKN